MVLECWYDGFWCVGVLVFGVWCLVLVFTFPPLYPCSTSQPFFFFFFFLFLFFFFFFFKKKQKKKKKKKRIKKKKNLLSSLLPAYFSRLDLDIPLKTNHPPWPSFSLDFTTSSTFCSTSLNVFRAFLFRLPVLLLPRCWVLFLWTYHSRENCPPLEEVCWYLASPRPPHQVSSPQLFAKKSAFFSLNAGSHPPLQQYPMSALLSVAVMNGRKMSELSWLLQRW